MLKHLWLKSKKPFKQKEFALAQPEKHIFALVQP